MSHFDQSVSSAQLDECLLHLPLVVAWSLAPALFALIFLHVRRSFPTGLFFATCIANLAFLVLALIFAWAGWSPSLTGPDRLGVVVCYIFLMLTTLGLSLAALTVVVRSARRELLIPSLFGLVSFSIPYFIYPLAVASYCDHANEHRTDTWRWVHCDDVIYFLDSRRGIDSQYAGQIEIFPPYFSLPSS